MVHETINIDIATHNLDHSFALPTQRTQQLAQLLQQQEIESGLQRSCSSFDFVHHQQQQQQQQTSKNDLLSSSFNDRLLPTSAENLSWSFFEEVSSLDNHLRAEETTATHAETVSQLIDTTQASTKTKKFINDVDSMIENSKPLLEEEQLHSLTITNKPNGIATKSKIAVDCVSQQVQQSTDIKQQHTRTSSTIPEDIAIVTLKRKKQLQQPLHPTINNNNNNQRGLITKNCNQQQIKQQEQQHLTAFATNKQQNKINNQIKQQQLFNDVSTKAMISTGGGGIEIDSDTTTTSTRIGKTRTLPAAIPLARSPAYADVGIIDLVGETKTTTSVVTRNRRAAHNKMSATPQSFVAGMEAHLGLSGWRKKLLYTLLVLLMLLIIVNLVLTLWILKVMEFSTDGMGPLKIIPGGIQLTGQALIMDMLRASTIRSRHGQPISIESSRNFSINTRDTNGILENHLFLGHDKLECLSTGFYINDTKDRNLFSVNRDEVTIGAHALRIDGEGGAIFRESIQTPIVRAEPRHDLRLESPTRQLDISAAHDINLKSRAGKIEFSALENIKLSALDGELRLESSKILMPNLRTAQPPLPGSTPQHDHSHRSIFQLCACSNGKLFLAAPHSICAGDETTVCS